MEPSFPGDPGFQNKTWLWKLALFAVTLGLGTWFFLIFLMRLRGPDLIPAAPDLQSWNPELRRLLATADAEARRHPDSAPAVGRLGMAYHANQFYDQAATIYGIAARLAPDDYRWSYCQALLQEENGEEVQLLQLLRKTVQLNSGHIPAVVKLADLFFKQDNLDQAVYYYERSVGADDKRLVPQAVFGLGRAAARRQEWNRVIQDLVPLAREYPLYRPPHQLLADAHQALGDGDKAAAELRTLLRTDLTVVPPIKDPIGEELLDLCCSATRLLKHAGFLSRFGNSDKILLLARRAVEVEPDDPDARHFLSRTLLKSRGADPKAVDDALFQLNEGLRLRSEDLKPLLLVADIFFSQNKTDAAIEQLRTMLARNTNSAEAHYYLGVATEHQGKVTEAVGHYREALRDDPNYAEPYHRLALILVKEGKLTEATGYLQKAIRLKPAFILAHFNLGLALERQGRIHDAIAQYSEVLRLEPNDAAANLNLGLVLAQLGRFEDAARHFREAVRIMPDDPEAHYDLGCALASLGKDQEAADEFRRALQLYPGYKEARAQLEELGQKKP